MGRDNLVFGPPPLWVQVRPYWADQAGPAAAGLKARLGLRRAAGTHRGAARPFGRRRAWGVH